MKSIISVTQAIVTMQHYRRESTADIANLWIYASKRWSLKGQCPKGLLSLRNHRVHLQQNQIDTDISTKM